MARFTQSAAMMLAVLSVSLALQSAKPRTRVETKVQALEATVGGLKDQVASLNDQVSALSVHTPEIHASDSLCTSTSRNGFFGVTAAYGGSYMAEWSGEDGVGDSIYVEWKNNGGTVRVDCFNGTTKVNSSGELRGDPRDLEGRLSAVLGARGLFDAIKASFEEGMTKEKCRDLVGVAPGSSNVNEFLSSKVKAAENLIAQSDTSA